MALTPKQEKFCQSIIAGMNQSEAYRSAYNAENMKPATIAVKANELLANGNVTVRIEELRKPVVEKLQYGLEEAMKEAAEAFDVSKGKEQGGAMVAAVQLRSKLNGLLVDRKEITVNIIETMSDADLTAFIAAKAKEAGVVVH